MGTSRNLMSELLIAPGRASAGSDVADGALLKKSFPSFGIVSPLLSSLSASTLWFVFASPEKEFG